MRRQSSILERRLAESRFYQRPYDKEYWVSKTLTNSKAASAMVLVRYIDGLKARKAENVNQERL
jgi:hypothetical protein